MVRAGYAREDIVKEKDRHATQHSHTDVKGLPDLLKRRMEKLSGFNMDHVRVHYGTSEPSQMHALAHARGKDIYVAPGQERCLPHEAWHVVQQMQGRVRPTFWVDGTAVNDDAALEHEADVMGAKAGDL